MKIKIESKVIYKEYIPRGNPGDVAALTINQVINSKQLYLMAMVITGSIQYER